MTVRRSKLEKAIEVVRDAGGQVTFGSLKPDVVQKRKRNGTTKGRARKVSPIMARQIRGMAGNVDEVTDALRRQGHDISRSTVNRIVKGQGAYENI